MIALSAEVRIHLATGATDLRKGVDSLAALVQQVLHEDPFGGHLFVFRGKRAHSPSFHIPFGVRAGRLSLASAARQAVAHRPAHDAGWG
jgi:transposase